MKKGKIYMVYDGDGSGFWMLGRCTREENAQSTSGELRCDATYIATDGLFRKETCWCYQCNNRSYREATQEEMAHFAECEKADMFIPLPKIINSYTIF